MSCLPSTENETAQRYLHHPDSLHANLLRVDATARDGKPNPLNEREAKAELWGRGLPVQRGTALENDVMGGCGGGLCREGRVRARLNSTGGTRENGTW